MKKIISFLFIISIMCSGIFSVNAQDTRSTTISLTQNEVSSFDFNVSNLVPGDDISQNIALNIEHNNDSEIKLKYIADEDVYKPLIEAFTVSIYIEELDKTIYSGELKDLSVEDLFVKYVNDRETINYTFNLHFKEETGNDCANKTLSGAFVWSCESVGEIPDDGDVVAPPQTGDNSNIWIYVSVAIVSICGLIILLIYKKRKGEENE